MIRLQSKLVCYICTFVRVAKGKQTKHPYIQGLATWWDQSDNYMYEYRKQVQMGALKVTGLTF